MGEGLRFATLATMLGKKNAARWGKRKCTIESVGRNNEGRWVMGTLADGTAVLGEPGDFEIPKKKGGGDDV